MLRREFLLGSVGALSGGAASPLYGQQRTGSPVIGFLVAGTQASHGAWVTTFAKRLSELGWTEGRNVKIQYRWAAGDIRQMVDFATEFARQGVDVIVTSANGTIAAKQVTSTIPIVFAAFGDPVIAGLAASLARPGGNVTGLTVQPIDLNSKRFQLLREMIPEIRRVAALVNFSVAGGAQEQAGILSAAMSLGIEAKVLPVQTADDIDQSMEKLAGHTDALYVFSEPFTNANKDRIVKAARIAKIPTIFGFREFVDAGGLISYGPDFTDLFRRAAELTDKVLRGAKPADIPVEQPVKFDLVINLKTAGMLGLNIPDKLIARADAVIE
jgi:putative ABC transport system substrate-binding protein